jgi:predicted AAA+ superfamily ATPase
MYNRSADRYLDSNQSFFLFGPRGTGKTTWLKKSFPEAVYLDLLESELCTRLTASPGTLERFIPADAHRWVIIDEVQRIPDLLNEVHRLIEKKNVRFVLTGSSARSLRKRGVNLLAGRALTRHFHPLTVQELGDDFNLTNSLQYGHLPYVFQAQNKTDYLASYIQTYLREEVLQEGLTRSLSSFTRFLEVASFSQAGLVNSSEIARETGVDRKTVENYFQITEDLLIGHRLPSFTKRSRRRLVAGNKFFFFDCGVFRALRPVGPLDLPEEVAGAALETLVFQELRALNDYYGLNLDIRYWRTSNGTEVDFVLYGERTFAAIEVKRARRLKGSDFSGLKLFKKDYPQAKAFLVGGVDRREYVDDIEVWPITEFLKNLPSLFIEGRSTAGT